MWEGAAIILIVAGIFFWLDSLRARERALKAGRAACERYELQFLDDTVSVTRVRLGRDEEGQLRIARTYTFEFSDTGNNRVQIFAPSGASIGGFGGLFDLAAPTATGDHYRTGAPLLRLPGFSLPSPASRIPA